EQHLCPGERMPPLVEDRVSEGVPTSWGTDGEPHATESLALYQTGGNKAPHW
ncbi:hypothetical protein NHX12_006425, partial [Muraenolepis orangiensis]